MKVRQILGYFAEGASLAICLGAMLVAFFLWFVAFGLSIGVLIQMLKLSL